VRERGSASVELAILAPAVLAVFVTLFIAGRSVLADQSIDAAAFDAARTASLARDAGTADIEARAAAMSSMQAQSINCINLTMRIDTSGFSVPVGQPANVTVEITCVVNFSDIALPGMPGSSTLRATFTSPLDQYRGRS
jgi:Flp pilus assembly protein TadG